MGVLPIQLIKQNLGQVDVFLEDINNEFIVVQDLPDTFSQGRSTFKIFGSDFLKKGVELKIELLEQKIDSIETQNDSLQIEKQELFDKIQGYDIEIQNLNKKIYVIRKDYKKRLDAVNQFTDAELQKFFSERYSIDNDSIK